MVSIYITQDKQNRIKLCCIEGLGFSPTIDYKFTFVHNFFCSKIFEMTIQGGFCGECAEFIFDVQCDDSGDLSIPMGIYTLTIVNTVDDSILFTNDQVRV